MKKKILTMCLSMLLITAMLPIYAFAAENQSGNRFTDVKESDFYYEPVNWAVEQGITKGTTGTTFSPDKTCTRGEAVTFLWRASGRPQPSISTCPYTDVSSADFYYTAALWAYENGITTGTTATTFSPNEICSRGQIVTFLYRAQERPVTAEDIDFADVSSNSFYESAVNWAAENGITTGTSFTQFSPNTYCTRGEMVTFLYRTMAKDIDWNFLFLIFSNVDITYTDANGQSISNKASMTDGEIELLKRIVQSFEEDLYEMSRNVVKPNVTVAVVETPITFDNLVYTESLGYYLDTNGAYDLIPATIDLSKYDHVTAFANIDKMETNYFGLGGTMFSQGAGFSFINNYNPEYAMWVYDETTGWPPSVIVHEFLHFMETWSRQCRCSIPISADSGETLGYNGENSGFRDFYTDFITHEVKLDSGVTAGVPCGIWRQPPHLSR